MLTQDEIALCEQAAASCPSFNLRKSARAVSRVFDEALQPSGLRSGQFVMLLAIGSLVEPTYSQLARDLVMDTSTIARSLRPLQREGLIAVIAGPDRRRKTVKITAAGAERVRQTVPLWRKAQARFNERVGEDRWSRMLDDLGQTLERVRGY
ncbi:MAG: MarR family winged helix-turn-helix transcriptional regulator [Sphingomonadales bacterium]